ncbi:MAG: glycosyltransferase family 2 protein [Nitrospirae bacterium]|nr:glycosyltransferase family 2 protein [Nitrospirota bacterium]
MSEQISVVIPTRNRPNLVCKAVESALAQTFKELEVIVVIDGPDEATEDALGQITDPRVRILPLPENVGGSDARNAGVRAARYDWVAFLDDDDEWLPEKLMKQINLAVNLHNPFPVMSCLSIVRTPGGDLTWPKRFPQPSEQISEYLCVRNSFYQGDTKLITSSLLIKKLLLERVPFRSGMKKYQEFDWALRAAQVEGVSFQFVPEPLYIYYAEQQRKAVSSQYDWKYFLHWLRENRNLFTTKAYAGYVATDLSAQAAQQGQWEAFVPLLRELFKFGVPRSFDLLLFMGMWFIPMDARHKIRNFFKKNKEIH